MTFLRGAVLIPLFVAAVLPDTINTLVCRYTGVAMPAETCCPEQDERVQDGPAQLRDESCCVVKNVHFARLLSDRLSAAPGPTHDGVCATVPSPEPSILAARAPTIRKLSIPSVGPPLLLVKQAFLI